MSFREKDIGIIVEQKEKPILKLRITLGQLLKGGTYEFEGTKLHFKQLK